MCCLMSVLVRRIIVRHKWRCKSRRYIVDNPPITGRVFLEDDESICSLRRNSFGKECQGVAQSTTSRTSRNERLSVYDILQPSTKFGQKSTAFSLSVWYPRSLVGVGVGRTVHLGTLMHSTSLVENEAISYM